MRAGYGSEAPHARGRTHSHAIRDRLELDPPITHDGARQGVERVVIERNQPARVRRTPENASPHLFTGDACPTIHHAHPAASLGYDMMAYEAMLSKRRVLGRASDEGWIVAFDHDPLHAFARAATRDGRVELEPVPARA